MLEGFALLGLVALGVAVTMIAGELDLSVASVAAVAGIIAVELSELGLVPCVLVGHPLRRSPSARCRAS